MANKFYGFQQIREEETPKKIILHLKKTSVIPKEAEVQGVLGRTILWGIGNCIIATKDEVIFFENEGTPSRNKRVPYNSISAVTLEGGFFKNIILSVGGSANVVLNLMADPKETEGMYNLLISYTQKKETEDKNNTVGFSGSDEIEKFYALKEKGVITEEEFEQKKMQLLGL